MSEQILPGVPATVPRDKVIALVEALGFKVGDLHSLTLHPQAIYAEVYADRDALTPGKVKGSEPFRAVRYVVDGEKAAMHRICVRITDES